jgi:hypothetical protein
MKLLSITQHIEVDAHADTGKCAWTEELHSSGDDTLMMRNASANTILPHVWK